MANIYYVDQLGYNEFLNDLEKLRNKLNDNGQEKSSSFNSAVGDGWHDNFDFEEASREEKKILKQIADKQEILKQLVIIKDQNLNLVCINDTVLLTLIYDDGTTEKDEFLLTGKFYANQDKKPTEITLNSPIGKAIFQKKYGSQVEYTVGNQTIKVKIEKRIL